MLPFPAGCMSLPSYYFGHPFLVIRVCIPVVPHEAVPEVSKGNLYIKQKKHVPIEIVRDMFEHFALRAPPFAELFLTELLFE